MFISGWHIDGFGVFRHFDMTNLSSGLNVFYGANEAGKSTLLEFLRTVLFGPPQGKNANRYPPLSGGRHGGRLLLQTANGCYVVERILGRRPPLQITLPEGSAGTEADLYVLLGGADRKLFSSIFAFGLEELSSREMLDAEETRARIFSAGITGAGNSAQSIISKLDAANQQLLRPKAAAKITTLIERLEAVAGELFEWQGKLERYPELLKHEMKCRQALKALAEEESRLQQDAHELRRLLDLWTPFCELRRAGAELEMLGPVPEHIEQAVEKVARLEEQRQALLGQMCEVNAASENAVRELSEQESRYQQHLEHLLAEVEYHCESAALQRDRLTSLPVQKKKISALTQALAEQLAAFGGTWTRENISSLPCFFANQEEGRVWQHVLGSLEQRVSQSTAGAEVALEKLRESEQRCEDLRQQLAKLPADGSALLDRQKGAVAEWRAAAQELSVLEEKLNYERSLRAEMESHLRFQRSAVKAFAFFFMCLAAALFIAGLMRTSFSDYTLSIPLFFAGAVLFVSGVVIFRRLKRTGLLGPASLANELKQSRRQVQIDAAQERIAQALEELELPLGSGRAAIDRLEEELQAQEAASRRCHELREELVSCEENTARKREAYQAAAEQVTALRGEQQQQLERWEEWKAVLGLPRSVAPDMIGEAFLQMERLRDTAHQIEQAESEEETLRQMIAQWTAVAEKLLVRAGFSWPVPQDSDPDEALIPGMLRLLSACREQKIAGERLRSMREEQQRFAVRRQALETQLAGLNAERGSVLGGCGANSEEEFLLLLGKHRRKMELLHTVRAKESVISYSAGGPAALSKCMKDLAGGGVDQWRASLELAEEKVCQVKEEREMRQRELFAVEQQRREDESSAELARLENEAEELRAALAGSFRQWLVRVLARDLIQETLVQYKRNRQPAVLDYASRHFSQIVPHYQRIVQEEEGLSLAVIDQRAQKKYPEQLSRGTAEQLYLCLRFGLVREFAARSCSLPLVMDDVLVNFDAGRAERIAGRLGEISHEQQILLFSCHAGTVSLIREAVPDARVITLSEEAQQREGS